jgi:quercetin dioxygenase-like cupin family protein
MDRRSLGIALVVLGIALAAMAGTALGTPPSGVMATTIASGSIPHAVGIHQAAGESTVIAEFTFEPGGTTGWHSHPGKTVVVVAEGEFTLYRDVNGECRSPTFGPGDAFVEKRTSVHMGVNEGDTPVVLGVAFFRVPPDGTTRIDKPDPGVC